MPSDLMRGLTRFAQKKTRQSKKLRALQSHNPFLRRHHRAKFDAVQMDRRRDAKMAAAEHLQAAIEIVLPDVERDIAQRAIGAPRIFFVAPWNRERCGGAGSVASRSAIDQNNRARCA